MIRKILTLCLIKKDKQILLGMKKRGFGTGKWNGFGGKLNEGENIEGAAKRELFEESGLMAINIEKIGTLDFIWQHKKEEIWEVHIFTVTDFSGQPIETEEMKPQWFDINHIPFETMWPDDIYWFPLFLENKKFEGKFLFDEHNSILDHNIRPVVY